MASFNMIEKVIILPPRNAPAQILRVFTVAIVWLSCGYRVDIEWLSSGYRAVPERASSISCKGVYGGDWGQSVRDDADGDGLGVDCDGVEAGKRLVHYG